MRCLIFIASSLLISVCALCTEACEPRGSDSCFSGAVRAALSVYRSCYFDISKRAALTVSSSKLNFVIMANYRLQPPVLGGKSYELYKTQLSSWEVLTDIPDEKRGYILH